MRTLESSLLALKIALAKYGDSSRSRPLPAPGGSREPDIGEAITPSAGLTRALDRQRELDRAYGAQVMLEVVSRANTEIVIRLRNLRRIAELARTEQLIKSEREFLVSQFDGLRQELLSRVGEYRFVNETDATAPQSLGKHGFVQAIAQGGVDSPAAARGLLGAVDQGLEVMAAIDENLAATGSRLAAAVEACTPDPEGTDFAPGPQVSRELAHAIASVLSARIPGNAAGAALAQANCTAEAVVKNLSV